MATTESTLPAEQDAPLAGIRVLEIGEMVAAPYATRLLADLGADVVKVEPPGGEAARRRGPFPPDLDEHPDASGLYLALNTNKRSVVVDPADRASLGRLAPLLDQADIVVTNLRPHQLAAYGIDLADLHERRPELVIGAMTPFGHTGPYADYRATELTISHAGGWAYQTPGASADVDEPPLKIFGHQTEFQAGLTMATVVMAALDRAEQTGVGDLFDFSTMAHISGMLEAALIAASYLGENPGRLGSRLLNPWKIFRCSDGLVFMVTVEPDQWTRLVEFMGHPEWVDTGLFDTLDLRLENEDLLCLYIEQWTEQHTVEELWREGQARRICFAPVLTMERMDDQPHLVDRGFFHIVDHPVAGEVKHLGHPFRWTGIGPDGANGSLTSDGTPDAHSPIAAAPTLDREARPTFGPGRGIARSGSAERRRPLEGIKVLDLTWVWAGPYCTMHLAFLGADVIKVESHVRPGLGRRLSLHLPGVPSSLNTCAYFNQWDQAKRSVDLDLADPESIEMIKAMASECDVLVENFATGVMDKLGLGYDVLHQLNPRLVVASISGYGSTGPLARYMGYGPTTGPLSGLSTLTGYAGGEPRELGIAVGDPTSGITAAFGITAALAARRRTGVGAYIDVALWETMAVCANEGWMDYQLTGSTPERMGNRDTLMAPHNCYRAASDPAIGDNDQWVSIACEDDAAWVRLANVIDADTGSTLASDRRFIDVQGRKTAEDELDRTIAAWAVDRDRWEITRRLQAEGVAAFPSLSPQDLLADPHLEARDFFVRLDHPEVGRRTHTGPAWRAATSATSVASPAPLMGQHSDEILAEFGLRSPRQVRA